MKVNLAKEIYGFKYFLLLFQNKAAINLYTNNLF